MIKDNFKFILIIACFYILLECVGITCPIKFITGISCAGCGMSRAWISLLKLDLKNAFYYHPLFWSVPILLWNLFGALICGIGPYISLSILIKNTNAICNGYNIEHGF